MLKSLISAFFICLLSFPVFVSFAEASSDKGLQPVEAFSRLPQNQQVKLSPSGRKLAYLSNFLDPEVTFLVSFDFDSTKKHYLLKSDNEKVKVNWFRWANDKTLLISALFSTHQGGVDYNETRLLAIEVDQQGEEARMLINPRRQAISSGRVSQFQDSVIDMLPNNPDHVLIQIDLDVVNQPSVYRLNIYTKRKSRVERGKKLIRDWTTDQQGRVRIGESLNYKTGLAKIFHRSDDEADWQTWYEYNALTNAAVAITPIGFAKDPNILYYRKYHGDKLALFKANMQTDEHELVFSDPDYDVNGSLLYSESTQDVIGIRHANSPNGRIYWDEKRKKFQGAINQALPDTSNYLVGFSQDDNYYLLYTESDHLPGVYYYGDRKKQKLDYALGTYPDIDVSHAIAHDLVTYQARDGLTIEGYLTVPENLNKPAATIIFPHGGPGARDYDGFDYWTSYFASRGYVVFRPNFRGSQGYGFAFAQQQVQRWGLQMQDDITDGLDWLVNQGITDADKVCIVGGSYGGYAALMAAVKTPDTYQCAVSFAGVSDLERLVRKSRYYTNNKFVKKQIGDDYSDLEARSPITYAENVKIPILLVHGEDDVVVDVKQSREMFDELEDENKQVTYVELENGDHYLSIQRNRHRFFKEMDHFLTQHLSD